MFKKLRHIYKMTLRGFIYFLALFFLFLVRFIPYDFLINLGGKISFLYFKIAKDRKKISKNLETAFPEKSKDEIEQIVDDVAIHFGKSIFELFRMQNINHENFLNMFEIKGHQFLVDALKKNRGILFLTGHVGNWEMMGAYISSIGNDLSVVAKKIYHDGLNDLLVKIRASKNVKTLLRSESTKDMIKVFKRNGCLGILIDQDTTVKGVFSLFFGKKCFTPVGATIMALKYKPVVLPIFIERMPNNRHVIEIQEEVEIRDIQSLDESIVYHTQLFNDILEKQIRKNPSQWVWVHDRWKTQK